MSKGHGRVGRVKPEVKIDGDKPLEPGEARVQLGIRVKRAIYDRMRGIAKSKGFLSVAEWARAVVLSAVAEK